MRKEGRGFWSGLYVQDGKLGRLQGQNKEQAEADDEANQGSQIASPKDHQAIPSTHYGDDGSQSVLKIGRGI